MDLATFATILNVGTNVAQGLYRLLKPDRARELQMEVLESQKRFRDRVARQAFGDFTAAERQQIRRAASPEINKIAGGVATRGLGTSGAGAQIIAEAQQAPFLTAQQAATQALSGANKAILDATTPLIDDGSFFDNLLAISSTLKDFKDPKKKDKTTNGNGTDDKTSNGTQNTDVERAVKTMFAALQGWV